MKLLYISTLDHIVHAMLPHLDGARARGWQVDVACNVTRDPEITKAHCNTLYSLPFSRNPLHPQNLIVTQKLIKLIRKEKYDIVHCHNPSGGLYGRLAATLSGVKPIRVYTAHGFHFHPLGGNISNFIYRNIERFAANCLSDAVLTINRWDFEQAAKFFPHKKLKKAYAPNPSTGDFLSDASVALYHWENAKNEQLFHGISPGKLFFTRGVGVSTDKFDPGKVSAEQKREIRNEFGVPEGHLLVTCIAEMIPRKGHEYAIHAVQSQNCPKEISLAIVGMGQLRESLEQEAKKANSNAIKFVGFRQDIDKVLAASDVFLLPAMQEGLPCSIQEALSMEIPVISYRIRGCTDLIDESCGILVDSIPSTVGLCNALHSLWAKTPQERKEMGRAGRKKMIERYDRPKCVAQVLEIYDRLLENRR